jgi:hypothetical protein
MNSGELTLIFYFQYPMKTYGYAVIFSLTGYLGLNFVLTMVKTNGALIAVTGEFVFSHFIHGCACIFGSGLLPTTTKNITTQPNIVKSHKGQLQTQNKDEHLAKVLMT